MMYASSNRGVDIGLVRERSATILLYSYFVRHEGVCVGKPFKMELSGLDATYEWAMRQEVGPLSTFLRASLDRPMCFVGSGGSFSAATFAAYLHEQLTTQVAEAITPLEFSGRSHLHSGAVLIMSAGGKNRDIILAFKNAVERDTKHLAVACFGSDSTLATLGRKVWGTELFCNDLPTGRDGFLATNSLLAFFILIARAYNDAGLTRGTLPEKANTLRRASVWSQERLTQALSRRYAIVLFGPHTRAAAVDLESKLSEAALAAVQLVDFRNFAHGRHHWIAKHAEDTGLIAFVSPDVKPIADRTFSAIGKRIPIARIDVPDSHVSANISALFATFEATRIAGDLRGIDPGRPGVPEFGRRIYNLRSPSKVKAIGGNPSSRLVTSRKLGTAGSLLSPLVLRGIGGAARKFVRSLSRPTYGAIVFDFDGTLCSHRERFSALRKDVAAALESLLRKNIAIGIATGRGKSVRVQMQQSLDRTLWEKLWIGYYNGSEVAQLSDDTFPNVHRPLNPAIDGLDKMFKSDRLIGELATITTRPMQITLEPKVPALFPNELWRYVSRYVREAEDARVLFSTHSVDIVPKSVSKLSVLRKLQSISPQGREVLCIGDLGQFPGNDFDLLAHAYSLSCDEVSADELSCWNFAPASFRGVQATLYYFHRMKITNGQFTLMLPTLREDA